MKRIIFDITNIICSSIELKKITNIKNSHGEFIGLPLVTLAIIRDCCKRFPDYSPIFIINGGYSEICKRLYPNYKSYNVYYEESRAISPDSDVNSKDIYKACIRILKNYIDLQTIIGLDQEYILGAITNGDTDEFIIVSEDDEFCCLLRPNCSVYRPYENTEVFYDSYLKAKSYTKEDFDKINIHNAIVGNAFDKIPGACVGVGDVYADSLFTLLENNNYDLSKFKSDERDLREECNSLGIKYRSAYLNFDKSVFDALCIIYDYRNTEEHLNSDELLQINHILETHNISGENFLIDLIKRLQDNDIISLDDFNNYKIQYRYSC